MKLLRIRGNNKQDVTLISAFRVSNIIVCLQEKWFIQLKNIYIYSFRAIIDWKEKKRNCVSTCKQIIKLNFSALFW